jgi:subtilase family serine protease
MMEMKVIASLAMLAMVAAGSSSCSTESTYPTSHTSVSNAEPATPRGRPMLARHLPRAVADGTATMMGAAQSDQRLRLAIHLPLRDQATLTQLLHDLYDPQSAQFHKYLSVAEFINRFAPTADDYNAVVAWATAKGLTVTARTSNRRLVVVEGAVDTINRAFNVNVRYYKHPAESRTFYSPDREPTTVGLNVPLLQVTGMNNSVLPRPLLRHLAIANPAGSGLSSQFLPSDLRAAYYGNGPLTGAGQTIGILSFDGYLASDVQLYYSTTGMSSTVPISNVLVDGFSGACTSVSSPTSSTCDDGEQVLDIVNAIGMAPGITQILFYEGSSNTEILNQMAVDNVAKVLSSSWAWNPADAASDDPIFQEFAAQGQSFVSASGDDGAFNDSTYSFPSVDPYITVVGGTVLTTSGRGGAWLAESAWPESGGGYVSGTPIPGWQQLAGVITSSNQGSPQWRNSPDVAAEADFDNPTVVNGVFETGYGGTSFAAPRWAGFLALVNQQSVANGRDTVGFINPALYSLGVGSNYASALHDITNGSNPPETGGGSGFNTVPGYDLVTGWGSPAGAPLIDQLAGTSANSAGAPAAAAAGSPAASYGRVFMYPRHGQSDAQQAADRRECSEWAATQTSPGLSKESAYSRAMAACGEARGYTVH